MSVASISRTTGPDHRALKQTAPLLATLSQSSEPQATEADYRRPAVGVGAWRRDVCALYCGRHWRVVCGGVPYGPYDYVRTPVVSAHGTVAFVAERGGQEMLVIDGHEGPRFDSIALGAPAFSEDGRWVHYEAQSAGRWLTVFRPCRNGDS